MTKTMAAAEDDATNRISNLKATLARANKYVKDLELQVSWTGVTTGFSNIKHYN